MVSMAGCAYAVYTMPTEFDEYVSSTKQFTADLYAGNLLSDMSQSDKDNIDEPKFESLDEILQELSEDDKVIDDIINGVDDIDMHGDTDDEDANGEDGNDGDDGDE